MNIRHLLLASVLFVTTSSQAFADYDKGTQNVWSTAPDVNTSTNINWTGFYAGLTYGGAFGATNKIQSNNIGLISSGPNAEADGVVGGLELGYNYQYYRYVFGIEGDISASTLFANHTCITDTNDCQTEQNWFATFRPRIGYTFGSFLPYATAGLAVGDVHSVRFNSTLGSNDIDANFTKMGFTLGAGTEYLLASNWSTKLEYLYSQYQEPRIAYPGANGSYKVPLNTNTVRVGLNYHFN